MENNNWYKAFPGAITVTDENGTILQMNDASAKMFEKDGGYEIMGRDAITCHPEPTQTKVRSLYETESRNVYSITKNGKKQLVYQTPYYLDGKFSGFVEICLDLPEEIPHFDRDKKK